MINRKTSKIKFNKKTYHLQGILPIDFINCKSFPFSYFIFSNQKAPVRVKRQQKLKTKKMIEEDKIKQGILKIGIISPPNIIIDEEKDNTLYNLLIGEIYSLTFDLSLTEKYFMPQKEVHREFAENIYFLSQKMNIEPYALYADIKNELPSLYNPKRWDFNLLTISAGLEREQVEHEEQIKKIKTRTR